MNNTMTITTTTIEALISTLSHFNNFEVTHTSSDPRIPKTFMCDSITVTDVPEWNCAEIVFNRNFLSPIRFNSESVSLLMQSTKDNSVIYSLYCTGDNPNTITIKASCDPSVYIPTQPCQIDDSFNSNKMIDYLMNPNFYDSNRSRSDDGLYVIDPNRLGVMTQRQEYIFENFMRFNLEQECYHDVLKTVCFLVKDWEMSIGLYNLESDVIEEMYEVDKEIAIERLKQFVCV